MPAYFSIVFQVKKANIYDSLFKDFTDILAANEFVFWGSDLDYGNSTLNDIIVWNTGKLNDDFELGYDEHCSHDFRQIYWEYHDFSEVRLFVTNEQSNDYFEFHIIIPEGDFICYDKGFPLFDHKVTSDLKKLAFAIWNWSCIETIQTEIELSDGSVPLNEIENGDCPSAFPFAIIPSSIFDDSYNNVFSSITPINRNGILLERKIRFIPY